VTCPEAEIVAHQSASENLEELIRHSSDILSWLGKFRAALPAPSVLTDALNT